MPPVLYQGGGTLYQEEGVILLLDSPNQIRDPGLPLTVKIGSFFFPEHFRHVRPSIQLLYQDRHSCPIFVPGFVSCPVLYL